MIEEINNNKTYPIEQIYSTLSYLTGNKNEILHDIYGRSGILVNKSDIYLFKPLEINDPNASLYDHYVPVEYKPSHVIIESKDNKKKIMKKKK